jgi:hypothetical protein
MVTPVWMFVYTVSPRGICTYTYALRGGEDLSCVA